MFVAFGVVAISAFSGKVSAGFTLLGAFALTDLWLAIKNKPKLLGAIIRTVILATATVAAFYIVIGGPNRLGNNTFEIGFCCECFSRFYCAGCHRSIFWDKRICHTKSEEISGTALL